MTFRVWVPIHLPDCQHLVVRIPPQAASVLNSKDKAPYIIYVEVGTKERTHTHTQVSACSKCFFPWQFIPHLVHFVLA